MLKGFQILSSYNSKKIRKFTNFGNNIAINIKIRYNKVSTKTQTSGGKKMLEMKNNPNKLEKVNESEVKLIIPDMVKNIMNHFEKYPTAKKNF